MYIYKDYYYHYFFFLEIKKTIEIKSVLYCIVPIWQGVLKSVCLADLWNLSGFIRNGPLVKLFRCVRVLQGVCVHVCVRGCQSVSVLHNAQI